MKKNYFILVILLIMVVGYAATQIKIDIKGNTTLSENTSDFNVYLANLKLNGTEIEGINATKDGYEINIPSKGTLEYDVINDSTEYDVEATVECEEETGTNEVTNFDYTGGEQTFVAPVTGEYKLETWGAQGGNSISNSGSNYTGGYGGYSTGKIYLKKSNNLYIAVGGQNKIFGGGQGNGNYKGNSNGGDTSYILVKNNKLENLKNDLESILIVSGGGGGSYGYPTNSTSSYSGSGGSGGGYIGNKGTNSGDYYWIGFGGSQITGGTVAYGSLYNSSTDGGIRISNYGSFGIGGYDISHFGAGGGAGFYGGGFSHYAGGGGGSGYIGNSLLTEKSMYCYKCSSSSEESTKTISTTCVSSTPTENCAKSGNGYARITLTKAINPNVQLETTTIEAQDKLNKSVEVSNNGMTCSLKIKKISRTEKKVYNGPTEWIFDYTGSEQTFTAPVNGTYKLETWGAQGGDATSTYIGGYGGYSTGQINIKKNDILYINVGESGKANSSKNDKSLIVGGYNGGGGSRRSADTSGKVSSGGGATHIANVSGLLSTLENKKSNILIVSGGGGGSSDHGSGWHGKGGHSGGYKGVSAYDCHDAYNGSKGYVYGVGGTQSESCNKLDTAGNKNGSFGKGAEVISTGTIGGGGGFYGGTSGVLQAGGGGSSYIGNPLLTEKSMYCYNCEESTEESTKTITTTCVNSTPTENCTKSGNGYARITLIK